MPNSHHLGAQSNKGGRATVSRREPMRAEYDFSKGERGRFYHPSAVFSFPIYLEPDVNEFLTHLAEKKQVDIQDLVNDWLRADMKLIRSVQ